MKFDAVMSFYVVLCRANLRTQHCCHWCPLQPIFTLEPPGLSRSSKSPSDNGDTLIERLEFFQGSPDVFKVASTAVTLYCCFPFPLSVTCGESIEVRKY